MPGAIWVNIGRHSATRMFAAAILDLGSPCRVPVGPPLVGSDLGTSTPCQLETQTDNFRLADHPDGASALRASAGRAFYIQVQG